MYESSHEEKATHLAFYRKKLGGLRNGLGVKGQQDGLGGVKKSLASPDHMGGMNRQDSHKSSSDLSMHVLYHVHVL